MQDDGQKPEDTAEWNYKSDKAPDAPETDEFNLTAAADTVQAEEAEALADQEETADDRITWTASEYLAHDRGLSWYAILAGGAVVVAAIIFFVSRDLMSTSVVAVSAIILGVFAARKPRVLTYELDAQGIKIAGKPYEYGLFKSFTILQESGMPAVELMPLKRFMAPLTIYFEPEDAEAIVAVIAHFLPHVQSEGAVVDRVMHHLRF